MIQISRAAAEALRDFVGKTAPYGPILGALSELQKALDGPDIEDRGPPTGPPGPPTRPPRRRR